jgi:hypothetical protein
VFCALATFYLNRTVEDPDRVDQKELDRLTAAGLVKAKRWSDLWVATFNDNKPAVSLWAGTHRGWQALGRKASGRKASG